MRSRIPAYVTSENERELPLLACLTSLHPFHWPRTAKGKVLAAHDRSLVYCTSSPSPSALGDGMEKGLERGPKAVCVRCTSCYRQGREGKGIS